MMKKFLVPAIAAAALLTGAAVAGEQKSEGGATQTREPSTATTPPSKPQEPVRSGEDTTGGKSDWPKGAQEKGSQEKEKSGKGLQPGRDVEPGAQPRQPAGPHP